MTLFDVIRTLKFIEQDDRIVRPRLHATQSRAR